MLLKDLIASFEPLSVVGSLEREIGAVVLDANDVERGDLFVAVEPNLDGGDLDASTAVHRGAAAVVAPASVRLAVRGNATVILVRDAKIALGHVLAAACGRPSEALEVLAVTGTNGKTTTAWLLHEILGSSGLRSGLIGTVEIRFGEERRPTSYTTPPAAILAPLLAEMRAARCTHVVMEATSHALALGRMDGTRIRVAGFTNLTRDHLDFHGSMAAYRDAKKRLFDELAESACIAVDDEHGAAFAREFRGPKLTVSAAGAPADVRAAEVSHGLAGTTVSLEGIFGDLTLELQMVGSYNVQNALVAFGIAVLAGQAPERAARALAGAKGAPGRCEIVPGRRRVIVDYAHTPDALERVLSTLRFVCRGRLICVFGAGGDRDRGKRASMGLAVASLADVAIITTDNPRGEAPEAIAADIARGMAGPALVEVELDRRKAIERAVRSAADDDIVLIAGKGHETVQLVGRETHAFDDRKVAAEILSELGLP